MPPLKYIALDVDICLLPLESVPIPSNVIEQHIITNLNCAINNT